MNLLKPLMEQSHIDSLDHYNMNPLLIMYLQEFGHDISKQLGSEVSEVNDYPSHYWALEKRYALTFLDLCAETLTPIAGGDIHSINDGQICVYSEVGWFYDRVNNECFKDFLDHSIKKAKKYLNHFSNKEPVLFSFTLFTP